MTKNSKKGFTLVELVVVIAILAILAAIAIPVVNSIINTASKNGALSNANTIELAVKEAQADIAAKNTEVYAEAKNAASATGITMETVATKKAIADAFKTTSYNGEDYIPAWDNSTGKCVIVENNVSGGSGTTIDGEALTDVVPLSTTTGDGNEGGVADSSVTVLELKSPAADSGSDSDT